MQIARFMRGQDNIATVAKRYAGNVPQGLSVLADDQKCNRRAAESAEIDAEQRDFSTTDFTDYTDSEIRFCNLCNL
jgi:hypothetical protein